MIKASPISNKKILVTESDDGFLDAYVCLANCGSAGSWTLTSDVGQVWGAFPPSESFRGFDVEFETATGAGLLVYNLQGGTGVQDLAYKILAPGATSFPGSPTGYVDLAGTLDITWVELDRKPVATSEELIVAAYATSNNQAYAKVWNGSAWVSETTLLVDTPNGIGREKLAVRYAADGSKGMVLAADNDSAGTPVMRSKYWNGTTWTTATPIDIPNALNAVNWVTLKADPSSDDLQAVIADALSHLHTLYWDGTGPAWAGTTDISFTLDTPTGRPADFEWEPTGSTGRLVWNDNVLPLTSDIQVRLCSPQCNSATANWSTYGDTGAWIALYRNPTASDAVDILGGRLNGANQLGSFRWEGGATLLWTNYGDSAITASSEQSYERFTIAFDLVTATPGAWMAYRRSDVGTCAAGAAWCPRIRPWTAAGAGTWGGEVVLSSSGSPVREAVLKASPVSERKVLITLSDDGQLDSYICAASCDTAGSWVHDGAIGTVWTTAPATHSRRFDVEFERSTGDAVLVYGIVDTGSTHDLAYRVLGSTDMAWGAAAFIDLWSGPNDYQATWIALDRDPSPAATAEEMIVVANRTASFVSAAVWNGSSWANFTTISGFTSGAQESIAVKYAADGTKGMVISRSDAPVSVASSYWDGTAWTSVAAFDHDTSDSSSVEWLTLKADPASDDLLAVIVDTAADLNTAYWTGSAWTPITSNLDTSLNDISGRLADFEWNQTGSTGELVYDTDGIGTTLRTRVCSATGCAAFSDVSTYVGKVGWIAMYRNPTTADTVDILSSRLNDDLDLGSFTWNGTGFSNYGDAVITNNTGALLYECYSIAFRQY
ncbi:MAG TPA: hypothetical protein VG389_20305 [Myxococcota bacterium]|nr:hypothetical protein [Myxococcota bacterium]